MSDTRTEKPTPRRLREARNKGQGFTRSQEVAVAFSLLGAVLSLRLIAPHVAGGVLTETRRFLAAAGSADPLGFAAERAELLRGTAAPLQVRTGITGGRA